MSEKITVENAQNVDPLKMCLELEKGNIIFFPSIPFNFPQDDIAYLLEQKQTGAKNRKNIAYKPKKDAITNSASKDGSKLKNILKNYCYSVEEFLGAILSPYKEEMVLDYTSFRPFQEKGRDLRLRARNDLLHVDAFPTRPMHGRRILRFFTNINPQEPRKWITGRTFQELVYEIGPKIGLPKKVTHTILDQLLLKSKKKALKAGIPVTLRSPYDEFMLKLHHYLKEDTSYQENEKKDSWSFPPNSCWMVFTDQVTHAALSGQYALEQTLLVPKTALINPENAPISILERMTGYAGVNPNYV